MSPLTLKRIKKAKGRVRISKSDTDQPQPTVVEWSVQVLEDGAWQTIYRSRDRTMCEQVISKANGQVILG